MTDSTERLISDLVEDLEPVRPLPRIRSAFAVILGCWASLLAFVLFAQESEPGARSLLENRVYLASFLGILVAALGGTASALAAGVPGRGRLEVAGMVMAALGLGAAAIACLLGMRALGLDAPAAPPGIDAMCLRESAIFSLLPAGLIFSFLVRGWTAHPLRAALVALIASGALGAVIVHLSCGFLGPRHLLVGHLSVPVVLAVLGLYPLGVILRRMRR